MNSSYRGGITRACGILLGVAVFGGIAFFHFRSGSETAEIWREPLIIEARGIGKSWQFNYSGADGVLGTEDDGHSRSGLYLPAGVEVLLHLHSADYIYVFSCPQLGLKEIAVPDLEYSIRFETGESGVYELPMSPMCGFRLPPGENMGTLTVVSKRNFGSWFARLPRSPQ